MRKSRFASRGLAVIVGIAAGAIALSGCSLIPGELRGESDVMSIVVGDCLNDASAPETVTTIPKVDCSEPHDSEVFATTVLPAGDFPGDQQVVDELFAFCEGDAFTSFVGIAYAESKYQVGGYFPTQDGWGDGDRELVCTIYDDAGQMTGSVKGAAE